SGGGGRSSASLAAQAGDVTRCVDQVRTAVTEGQDALSRFVLGDRPLLRGGRQLDSPAQDARGPRGLGFGDLQQRAVTLDQADEEKVRNGGVRDAVVESVRLRTGVIGQE